MWGTHQFTQSITHTSHVSSWRSEVPLLIISDFPAAKKCMLVYLWFNVMNWNYFTFLRTISPCMDISTMAAVDTNIWTLETFLTECQWMHHDGCLCINCWVNFMQPHTSTPKYGSFCFTTFDSCTLKLASVTDWELRDTHKSFGNWIKKNKFSYSGYILHL